MRRQDLRDPGAIVLVGGLGVVRLGQLAAEPGVRRVQLEQFLIDSDRLGDRAQAELAVGEPGLDLRIIGLRPAQRLVDLARHQERLVGAGPVPEILLDPADPELHVRQRGAEARVVAAVPEELVVEPQRRAKQVAAQRLEAGGLQERVLGDARQELVNRGAACASPASARTRC